MAAVHGFRHQAEEIPHTHGWLQYLPAFAQAKMVQAAPDRLYDLWRGEVGVGCRGPRRFILFSREQFLYRPRRVSPLRGDVVAEDRICQCAPAHVTGEDGLFLVGGVAVLGFEGFEQPDGRDIVARFLVQPAKADAVGVGYAEVAGGVWFWLDVEDDSSGRRISSIAISQAWWCSILRTDTRLYRMSVNRSAVSSSRSEEHTSE